MLQQSTQSLRRTNWHTCRMHESILRSLQSLRSDLRARWETRLRQAPIPSPLAAPDVLVHLMDWTLEELFKSLIRPPQRRRVRPRTEPPNQHAQPFQCSCGSNPLEAYFACLQKTLIEAVEQLYLMPGANNLPECAIVTAEIQLAFTQISQRELETFCSVCQHSHQPATMRENEACAGSEKKSVPLVKA